MSSDGSSNGSHNGDEPKKPSPSNSPRNSSRGRSIAEIIRDSNNLSPAAVGTSAVHQEGVGVSAPALPGIPEIPDYSFAPKLLNQSIHAPFGLSALGNNNMQQMGHQGLPNVFPTFTSQQNHQLPTLQTYMNQMQLLFMQQQQQLQFLSSHMQTKNNMQQPCNNGNQSFVLP